MPKLILITLILAAALLQSAHSRPKKTISFRFYLQDKYSGPGRTVYPVARSDVTKTSPTGFGEVSVVNDPLTAGPIHDSKRVGYAQGIIANTDFTVPAIHATVMFFFTAGAYSGSSFSIVGRNNLLEKRRRVPIVGGTGAFELARGIITTRNYSSDPKLGRATFQYDVAIQK